MNLLEIATLMQGIALGTLLCSTLFILIFYIMDKTDDFEEYLDEGIQFNTFENVNEKWVGVDSFDDFDEFLFMERIAESERRIHALEQMESLIDIYRAKRGLEAL